MFEMNGGGGIAPTTQTSAGRGSAFRSPTQNDQKAWTTRPHSHSRFRGGGGGCSQRSSGGAGSIRCRHDARRRARGGTPSTFPKGARLGDRDAVRAGRADIDKDGHAEVFLTTGASSCGKSGCETSFYKKTNGVWVRIGRLRVSVDEHYIPEIFVGEELIDGMWSVYSPGHPQTKKRFPDRRVQFGGAEEMFAGEEWWRTSYRGSQERRKISGSVDLT